MTVTTEASVLHGVKDLRLEKRQLLDVGPDDLQIAVLATGLCGSDLHYYNHYRNGDIIVREPLTLGHESSGRVVAVGSAVTGFAVGDVVALEVGIPCGQCELCSTDRYNICSQLKFRSSAKIFPHAQGTLQEVVNHPAKWCHRLPAGISPSLGALLEPFAVAVHATRRANLAKGSSVLVLGAGAVGLLCAAVCKAQGARVVTIADKQADRLKFALAHRFADATILVPNDRPQTVEDKLAFAKSVAQLVKEARTGHGTLIGDISATFECTGVEVCMQSAIYATQAGGKIMIIGMGNPIQTLPISAAALREVDLIGVFRYAHAYPSAIGLLVRAPASLPKLETLITHTFTGMDSIPTAFETAGRATDDTGKVVIKVVVELQSKSSN